MKTAARKYGWRPDLPDARDLTYSAPRRVVRALPTSADLRKKCPEVYNQLDLGSCTANAVGANFEFDSMAQGLPGFRPSRLQIYYDERELEGTVKVDAGAFIRDGIKVVARKGTCPESMWPYDVRKFAVKPPKKAYESALKHTAVKYRRVPRALSQMQGCLAEGRPFVFGFSVYESFESDAVARTGVLSLPAKGERLLGGHAVMAVGYSSRTKRFIVRNSWGSEWGKKGYFTMPFEFLLDPNLSDDFWTIETVI